MRFAPLLILPLAALTLLPAEAQAQTRSTGGRPGQSLGSSPGTIEGTRRPPPAALPGLVARGTQEPIPADPAANLAPTPALFDAINRGDMAAAREAVARGADPDGRNVLGLTPLDAAVDQGRNEIMFFLLSVRGGRPTGQPSDAGQRSAFGNTAPAPAPTGRAARAARAAAEREPPAPAPVAAAPAPRAPNAPAGVAPRLWANDGGAAQPDIGFLGFDAGRPAGATPPAAAAAPAAPARRARS